MLALSLARCAAVSGILVAVLAPASAAGAPPLRLLRGPGACLSLNRVAGCGRAVGFTNPNGGGVMSADGSSIYLPSDNDALFGAVARDRTSGRLSELAHGPSCWRGALAVTGDPNSHAGACEPVRGLGEATRAVAVSPDGRSVYVASGPRDQGFGPRQTEAVAVFARAPDGSLAQLPGAAGCVASAPLDDCAVASGMTAQDLSVAPDGGHVYASGSVLSVFARDAITGGLSRRSCLSAGPTPGCTPAPFGLSLWAPVFTRGGRFAYALGERHPAASVMPDAQALVGFAPDSASGRLAPLSVSGGCVTRYSVLSSFCTLDPRLAPVVDASVAASADGELYLTASPFSYSVPPPRGAPFDVLALPIDPATGAMTTARAACLSSARRPGCILDHHVQTLRAIAPAPNGRRVYGVTGVGVVALSRAPASGALRRLGPSVRGCGGPFSRCPPRRQPINEPHQVLVSPDGRFAYVVSSNFADTGTVATLRLH